MNEQQVHEIITKSHPEMCIVIERVTARLNEVIPGTPFMLRCRHLNDEKNYVLVMFSYSPSINGY